MLHAHLLQIIHQLFARFLVEHPAQMPGADVQRVRDGLRGKLGGWGVADMQDGILHHAAVAFAAFPGQIGDQRHAVLFQAGGKLVDFLDFFEKNGVGVSNASPFSMGLLTERGVPDWHPAPKPLVRVCEEAAQYCKEKGYPIEKLAMQFSVSNPRIASTIFSTTRPENLKKNLAYIEEPIDWDLVAKVREIIGDQQRVSWANT